MDASRRADRGSGPNAAPALGNAVRARIEDSVARARSDGRTRFLAHAVEFSLDDPLACYAHARTRDRFLWARGETGDWSVCLGLVDETESAGPDRFRDVRAWVARAESRFDWTGIARPKALPAYFGGFGFEPESRGSAHWKAFPAARFVLPEVILERHAGVGRGVALVRVEPGSSAETLAAELRERLLEIARIERGGHTPETARPSDVVDLAAAPGSWPSGPEYRVRADRSHDVFRAQVDRARADFASGALEKIVLARSLSIDHDGAVDVVAFLGRLRGLYPTCALIAVGRGDDTFLSATPETLVRVRDGHVETAALAGSAPRGRTPDEDVALANALISSPKEQAEHAHVVKAIRSVLEANCASVEVPVAPALRRLFGIQHLETPIEARLGIEGAGHETQGDAVDVLALVEALHPTPAVGGVPRSAALEWLARTEGLDRGWYAAPVGWLDRVGGGEFSVALRSALIRNGLEDRDGFVASRTLLFAGAGIVAESDPEQELVETRIKLRALLAPLTEI